MDALTLLSGDASGFADKVWGSQVHVHHAEADRLTALLSLDDVDHVLTSTGLRTPALRVAQDGVVLPARRFTRTASLAGEPLTGLVDGRKVLDLFESGATVVLQGLHRYWPPLTSLVRELELSLGHPCQANAYLTPSRSQGFALHSDTHDVFVFQTHGSKQWEIHDEAGAREVVMEPGVSMYLPTGTPHAARAQHEASLHVTVGINQLTWRQLLRRVTDELLRDEQYAGRLPAGYVRDPEQLVDDLRDHLLRFSVHVANQEPEALASEQAAEFLRSRIPVLRGGLRDRVQLDDIDDGTVLERRTESPCVLVPHGDRLRVLLGDRELDVPGRLRAPMQEIADRASLRVDDLSPWLDPESRLVLVRRLVREGLLRVTG